MIKKLSDFIVNKRIVILAVMLILSVVSAFCSRFVEINDDMTKYLPDDSNMKAGLDIMEAEFPETETSNTIRVMFDGLTDAEKITVLDKLSAITHVDSVDYDAESKDHNKGEHTLFVLNMSCGYGSDEEAAIEAALRSQFADYTMVWKNDDSGFPPIPPALIVTALAILLTVLFIMCGSWIEPLLFLVVIGVAVVINGGTNLMLGSVASITNSIAAILQLVLSMDYSIILMNRYRQEKELEPDSRQAMKNALASSFSSVASSSFTTITGLLMLIFMSFKISANLGIVLAKGVLISMVCVLSMLPGIILICDKLIQKTAKKALHIPTEWAAGFSYKMRYIMTGAFVILFVGSFILQQKTGISYTLAEEDEIADIFPKSNTVVMVYENQDEDKMRALIDELEDDKNITSVTGYGTILDKPYTSGELAEALKDISEDISLNSGVVDMLYYDHYSDGKVGTMTASEFLSFISDTVINDEAFSEYIDDDIKEKAEMLDKFSDAGELTSPKTCAELADLFGIDADTVELLFILYKASLDDYSPKAMTLPEFADFLQNDIISDPTFSSFLDESAIKQAETLAVFSDSKALRTPKSAAELSSMLGIDLSLVKTVFVLHNAQDISGNTMTLSQFSSFLNSGLLSDPMFGSSIDSAAKARLKTMDTLIQLAASKQEITPEQMAQMFGSEAHSGGFTEEEKAQLAAMEQLLQLAGSGTALDPATLAQTLGIDKDMTDTVFRLYYGGDISGKTLSMEETVDFILADQIMKKYMDNTMTGQLTMLRQMIKAAVNGTSLTYSELSELLGMDGEALKMLYTVKASENELDDWTLSVSDFIDFILDNVLADEAFADRIDADTSDMLYSARTVVNAVVSGNNYSAPEMEELLGGLTDELDSSVIELIYLYAESSKNPDPERTMTMETLLEHMTENVLNDPRFEPVIDEDMRQKIIEAQDSLYDGKKQLVSENYSRLIITTSYPEESAETTAFLADLEQFGSDRLSGEYYFVGNSAMNYEMQKTFHNELLFITLLTALAIFLIVALTFRSLSIPLILVLLVQCGVYITVTITGALNGSIYYLALLVVECILMGSTVDYGILLTNYYCEARKTTDIKEALKKAYSGSIHTIMTSGLILILVTATVGGMFNNPTVEAIVKTISMGALCVTILILFVLPGILAACDRIITRKK